MRKTNKLFVLVLAILLVAALAIGLVGCAEEEPQVTTYAITWKLPSGVTVDNKLESAAENTELAFRVNLPSGYDIDTVEFNGKKISKKSDGSYKVNIVKDSTIEVKVTEQITAVRIKTNPATMTYFAGETLDKTGMEVVAVYSVSGERALSANDYVVTPSLFEGGETAFTVAYKGVRSAEVALAQRVEYKVTIDPKGGTIGGDYAYNLAQNGALHNVRTDMNGVITFTYYNEEGTVPYAMPENSLVTKGEVAGDYTFIGWEKEELTTPMEGGACSATYTAKYNAKLLNLTGLYYENREGTPTLVIEGTFLAAQSAYLYLYEGNDKVELVGDTIEGARGEQFELPFDMTKLVEAGYLGKWMDIKFRAQEDDRVEEMEIVLEKYGEGFVDLNDSIIADGKMYYFEQYAGTLKAVYAEYKYEFDMTAAATATGATLTISGRVFDSEFFGKAVAIDFWPGGEGTTVSAPIDAHCNFSAEINILAFALNTTNYAHFKVVESVEDATELYRDGNDGNLGNAKWVTTQELETYNIDLIENAQAIRFEYNGGEKVFYVGCGKWGGIVLYGQDERMSDEAMSLEENDGTVYLVYSGYIRGYDSAEAVVEFYTEQFAYVDIINDTNWGTLVLTAHDEEASKVIINATYVEAKGAYLFTVKIPVMNAEAGMYYFFHAPDSSSNLQIKGALNTTAVTATIDGVTLKYQLEKRTGVDDWKQPLVWVKVTEA